MTELRHRFHGNGDGTFTIAAHQDVEPILEANKAMQATKQTGDMRLVASIPSIFVTKWLNDHGFNLLTMGKRDFETMIRKMRRDPDYRHLFVS